MINSEVRPGAIAADAGGQPAILKTPWQGPQARNLGEKLGAAFARVRILADEYTLTINRGRDPMAKRRKVNNLMALALLALLVPGRPMHPYEMANMLRRTNKEQDMKIKWGSLYTVVANLEKHGFIEATGSSREGRRPERTVYAITDAGRAELTDWLHELVSVPEPQYPPFKAALSVLGVLSPDDAIAQLQQRLRTLDESIANHRAELAESSKEVARIFLVEEEYELAMREAEARWIGGLLQEVADGTLPGVAEWRAYHETGGGLLEEWAAMVDEGGPPPD